MSKLYGGDDKKIIAVGAKSEIGAKRPPLLARIFIYGFHSGAIIALAIYYFSKL